MFPKRSLRQNAAPWFQRAGGYVPTKRHILALLSAIALIVGGTVVTAGAAIAASYNPPAARQRVDLNAGWRFHKGDVSGAEAIGFNDGAWSSVDVPHTWNAADGADGGNNYYRGVGWYRRHYTVPAAMAGKMFFLQFAGANQVADVWANGIHLGQHSGGYARFRFGATSALKVGQDNVIAVRVTNADNSAIAPLSADYTFDGGIYRNVSLQVVDPLAVRLLDYAGPGIYLRQRSVTASSATVDVTSKLFNNYGTARSVVVRTVVTDAAGTVVADQSLPARTLGAASGVDVTQTVTIANPHRWDGVADPYLYHANVEIRDVAANRVTDVVTEPLGLRSYTLNPNTGFTLNGHPLDLHGVNLHQDRAVVGWAVDDSQHIQDFDLIQEMGANAVRLAHYQHDQKDYMLADERGIVAWSEIPLVNNVTDSAAFTANAKQQLTELIRQNYNHPSIIFWGIGNEQRNDDSATNSLLSQLAGGSYNDLGGQLDSIHQAAPAKNIALCEYGAGANTTQHALNPGSADTGGQTHPEEYQSLLHEASWKQIAARPYVWGSFVWNMFDFASDGRNEGGQPGINDKGLVTRDRQTRKDSFYFYKANWASTPTLYITSRRWTKRTTAATELKVYSNAATVTATLNGASLGPAVAPTTSSSGPESPFPKAPTR
jgi:beta-galactosidase